MAKAPAHKALSEAICDSTVRLALGDNDTDEATVSIRVRLTSKILDDAPRFSTGMTMSIHLPEGTVMADPVAAKALARAEAAAILRKMAGQVSKGEGHT